MAVTLYSPRQIALAAFLGTPIAAAWFIRVNHFGFGDEQAARRSIWVGLAATIGVFALAFVLPDRFPDALLPALYTAAIHWYASAVFGPRFDKHISDGGPRGSWWFVVGVSLITVLAVLGAAIGVLFALMWAMPSLFGH